MFTLYAAHSSGKLRGALVHYWEILQSCSQTNSIEKAQQPSKLESRVRAYVKLCRPTQASKHATYQAIPAVCSKLTLPTDIRYVWAAHLNQFEKACNYGKIMLQWSQHILMQASIAKFCQYVGEKCRMKATRKLVSSIRCLSLCYDSSDAFCKKCSQKLGLF